MLSIISFLEYASKKDVNAVINNNSWEECAVGEFFRSEGIKFGRETCGLLRSIVDPNYKRSAQQFQDDMDALIVDVSLLNSRGRGLGGEGEDNNTLYQALNNGAIDDYEQLVEVMQDAMNNNDMYKALADGTYWSKDFTE